MGSWRIGGVEDCRTGETGTVEADDPGGPDDGFKLPELEEDDCDWVPRAAGGFSIWTDSKVKERGKGDITNETDNLERLSIPPLTSYIYFFISHGKGLISKTSDETKETEIHNKLGKKKLIYLGTTRIKFGKIDS